MITNMTIIRKTPATQRRCSNHRRYPLAVRHRSIVGRVVRRLRTLFTTGRCCETHQAQRQQHNRNGGGQHERHHSVHAGQQHERKRVQRSRAMRTTRPIVVRRPNAKHEIRADHKPAEQERVDNVARVALAIAFEPLLFGGVPHERRQTQQRPDQPNEAGNDEPAGDECALRTVVHVDAADGDHQQRHQDVNENGDWKRTTLFC